MTSDLGLIAKLADPGVRPAAVAELAARAGARQVYAFVADAEIGGKLIPAPGFAPTVPGGRAWRDAIAAAREPGHRTVDLPVTDGTPARVAVLAYPRLALFFAGGVLDEALIAAFDVTAPLLAAVLAGELRDVINAAAVRSARDATAQAAALASALDQSRGELQRALVEVERHRHTIDDALRRAEHAARAKDEFLAMLGHELRNPLAPIVTAVHLLRLRRHSSRELDVIERQVAHLMRLVDDLLDVSRITTGRVQLRVERVELAEVAARAIEMASPLLEKKQQDLVVDVPSTGLAVDGDPARLAQVVANLLTNAAKYSDARTRVRLLAERAGEGVRIVVEDHGIGLAPHMLGAIFEQFVQSPQGSDRAEGGLGLGLAIVRSLVRLHGGRVHAESEGPGRGSRFVVELPASSGAHVTRTGVPLHLIPGRPAAAHILVVDDNEDARQLLGEVLDLLGYTTSVAADGASALAAAAARRPDIALLDLGLPVMDGYELARRLCEQLPALKLVAVTGYGQRSDQERTARAGFHAHLVKPIDPGLLERTLAEIVSSPDYARPKSFL